MTVTVRLISAPLRLTMAPPLKVTLSGGAIADAPAVGLYLRGGGTWHLQDPDLTAIGELSSTGWLRRTAPNSWALSLTVPWADISGAPTTLAGYGITDALTAAQIAAAYQPLDSDLTALASDYSGASKVLTANSMQAATSAGLTLRSNNGTTGLTVGAGGGANVTTADGLIVSGLLQANAGLTVTGTTTIGGSTLSLAGNTSVSVFGASLIDDATNADARNTLGLGTIATQNAASVAITGGAVNNTPIGATTPSSGAFTALSASSSIRSSSNASSSVSASNQADFTGVSFTGRRSNGEYIFELQSGDGANNIQWRRINASNSHSFLTDGVSRLLVGPTDPGSVSAGQVAIGGGVVRAAGAGYFGGNTENTASVAGVLTHQVTNTSPGGGALARFQVRNDLGDACRAQLVAHSSAYTTAIFGITAANYLALRADGASVQGMLVGCVGLDRPIIFGVNTSEIARVVSSGINLASGKALQINGTQVVGPRGSAIANPSGGATVDAEARIAIANILSAMRTHGSIAT
jgi:hypothetical protein